ncbi:MAG TPA: hypothetical protein VJT71_12760 [Pyrinomonadaceae bacterium]|nr:hypothetical protein [Pyrinomonadaceae bacterium]
MKTLCIALILIAACAACAKKTSNSSEPGPASAGTKTETKPAAEPQGTKDLSGTWVAEEGGRTWELVIVSTGPNTWTTTPTLLTNPDKNDLIYGKPGDKGDQINIVGDGPGKFKVQWAKKENFHEAAFWPGTGTYDDNTFNFAGYYMGKRKA